MEELLVVQNLRKTFKLSAKQQKLEKTKDKKIWKMLKRWLPASWLQKRAYTCNYETLTNWYYWRKGHKLSEWKTVLDWIESLPYANILILGETINDI